MKTSLHLVFYTRSKKIFPTRWEFERPKKISLGYLPQSSICLPFPDVPSCEVLFQKKNGKSLLRLPPQIQGFLHIDSKAIPFSALREVGLLRKDAKGDYLLLHEKMSGTFLFGSLRLNFETSSTSKTFSFSIPFGVSAFYKSFPIPLVITLLFSLGIHLSVFSFLKSIPSLEVIVSEVQQHYYSFEPPSADFVREQLQKIQKAVPKDTAQNTSRRKERRPKKIQSGFLKAVAKAGGMKSSPFSHLFTTQTLSSNFKDLFKGKTVEETIRSRLANAHPILPTSEAEISTVEVGPMASKLSPSHLRISSSKPEMVGLSKNARGESGEFNSRELEDFIASRAGELRICYERALGRNPQISGKLVVEVTIQTSGKVSQMALSDSTLHDPLLERCILQRVQTWIFPKPQNHSVSVKFPFVFTAVSKG